MTNRNLGSNSLSSRQIFAQKRSGIAPSILIITLSRTQTKLTLRMAKKSLIFSQIKALNSKKYLSEMKKCHQASDIMRIELKSKWKIVRWLI